MNRSGNKSAIVPSPTSLFLTVLVIFLVVEGLVMFLLPMFVPEAEHLPAAAMADALMLVVLSTPFLWWFVVRPLRSAAADARLRAAAIVETVPEGIIAADETGAIRSFNSSAELIFGYKEQEVLGRPVTLLMPEQYREAHKQELERARRGGETRVVGTTRETRGLRKDGREFPLELSLSTLETREGISFIRVIRDITERKQAEAAMDQVKADFTAMLVHDLRSPLMTVLSASALVEDGMVGPVNEEQKKWLRRIETAGRSLLDLVNDVLDLSKIEAGRIDLVKEKIDLAQKIKDNLEAYSILAREKGISLKSSVDPRVPPIQADPRRLDQVFTNLLSNAIKFTPEGGKIEMGARQEDGEGIIAWVKDSGVGISNGEINHLFQKYKQTGSAKTTTQKGTGLGLAISKKIVAAHGGRIWVESEENKGTTLFFSLPVNP